MRVRDPKTTALIFASGKIVYARIVQKLDFDAKFSEFKIQNIVGSVKFPIRLEGLAYSHGQFSSYELEVGVFSIFLFMKRLPQLFPAQSLIFVSGKIVLTGAKVCSFLLFTLSYIRRSTCARRTP
ncbi:hypothetical protein B0H14DRAFT_2890674, partial [Mycena olivaceomarginata]